MSFTVIEIQDKTVYKLIGYRKSQIKSILFWSYAKTNRLVMLDAFLLGVP